MIPSPPDLPRARALAQSLPPPAQPLQAAARHGNLAPAPFALLLEAVAEPSGAVGAPARGSGPVAEDEAGAATAPEPGSGPGLVGKQSAALSIPDSELPHGALALPQPVMGRTVPFEAAPSSGGMLPDGGRMVPGKGPPRHAASGDPGTASARSADGAGEVAAATAGLAGDRSGPHPVMMSPLSARAAVAPAGARMAARQAGPTPAAQTGAPERPGSAPAPGSAARPGPAAGETTVPALALAAPSAASPEPPPTNAAVSPHPGPASLPAAVPVPLPGPTAPGHAPATAGDYALPPPALAAIDHLADLRESARAARPEMIVRHAEFGLVSLRIEAAASSATPAGEWRAVLASRDSEFVPAVQIALAERTAMIAAEAAAPANGLAGGQPGGLGGVQGAGNDPRYGSSPGSGQGSLQPGMDQDSAGGERSGGRPRPGPQRPGEEDSAAGRGVADRNDERGLFA